MRPRIFKDVPTSLVAHNSKLHASVDKRTEFIHRVNDLIPEDYAKIVDFYDRFRKFDSFTPSDTGESPQVAAAESASLELSPLDEMTPQERTIQNLQLQLVETIKRSEESDKCIRDMVSDYQLKTVDIKSYKQEIEQLKTTHSIAMKRVCHTHSIALDEFKLKETITTNDTIEDLKASKFVLMQQLSEASHYKTKLDAMGKSEKIKVKTLGSLELKMKRLKNMNSAVVGELKIIKQHNDKLYKDNTQFHSQFIESQVVHDTLRSTLSDIHCELTKKEKENSQLVEMFTQLQKKETGAIESVLGDRIQDIEAEKQTLQRTNTKLSCELRDLKTKMQKYTSLIGRFSNISDS